MIPAVKGHQRAALPDGPSARVFSKGVSGSGNAGLKGSNIMGLGFRVEGLGLRV